MKITVAALITLRTDYAGSQEGIAEARSGEWICLLQTLTIADEAGRAEKDVNR